jgi:hypothetical protein
VSVIRIGRALLSVSDKTGLAEFAHELARHGVKIVSTGGTAAALREAGVTVRDVSEATGYPELFEGRVKTLHPAIHGGILYRRGVKQDEEDRHRHGIVSVDLVVVNLYPFERTVAAAGTSYDEAVEQIDIGGPALLRAGAKNHRHVAVVVDPDQYAGVIEAPERRGPRRGRAFPASSRRPARRRRRETRFPSRSSSGFAASRAFATARIRDRRERSSLPREAARSARSRSSAGRRSPSTISSTSRPRSASCTSSRTPPPS